MARIIHGGRRVAFYTFTNGTTPSIGTTPVFTGTEQLSTDVAKDDTGLATITIEQIQDDDTFNTFIRTYAPQNEGGGIEDILFEDGTQLLGAASGTKLFCIVKGGVAVDGTNIKAFMAAGSLSKASGSWSQSGNTYNRPSLVFTSVAIEGDVTVANTYLTDFQNAATTTTMDADLDKYGKTIYG